ncbi:hypothetical protein E2986_03845 [Frieseomelitta varia]|uniref:Argininosuccinate lyase n=1 Tax=Frieseomelitta varia TaxID=561572 RepID=A0A833RV42_9HYME|nr:hypothetical protein E2986_03845 [Frieseomelitta varia]
MQGSIAYAKAIRSANLLSHEELQVIVSGLEQVKAEWEKGQFTIHVEDEDIHAANERRLSRHIFVDDSYAWYAKTDVERLQELRRRVNVLPLGSGAIAGNPFQIDRRSLASELNFSEITENSMYAVGDRDFVAEFLFWSSLTAIHLSRLCEDLIIYSSKEFDFVRLADRFSTGSSLMPQKRNPDCMELIRGKTGTLLGKCMGFMATLKGIPSTYNKDLQEDKEALFSSVDVLNCMFVVITGALETLKIPFREAHHSIGKVVALSESLGVSLCELTLEQLQTVSETFEEDVMQLWNICNSVEQYNVTGGTSTSAIAGQISNLRAWLQQVNPV